MPAGRAQDRWHDIVMPAGSHPWEQQTHIFKGATEFRASSQSEWRRAWLPRVSNAAATPPKLRSLNGRVHELDSRNLGSQLANSRNLGSPLANLVPGILRVVGADGIHERTGVKATSRMPVMM